jgi:tRNA-specific 2-thiouridylase
MQKRVLVGLSGGVDSLATALLLKEKGFHIIGIWLDMFDELESNSTKLESRDKLLESSFNLLESNYNQLKEKADKIGFELYRYNIKKEFEERVIDYFSTQYINGKTPNICVHCNQALKIPTLLSLKSKYSCDYIATGHYANIRKENKRYVLSQAKDKWKDQSYMLCRLSQEALSQIIFPLGNYLKEDIKNLIREKGFEDIAKKRESYGICFLGEKNYQEFLIRKHPELSQLNEGNVIDNEDRIIGNHNGYPFYTIGQCRGFNISLSEKQYINSISYKENTLKVGSKSLCYKKEIRIRDINFIKYSILSNEHTFKVKIRGKEEGEKAKVIFFDKEADIVFDNPVFAPMQGQSIVIYENNDIVCSGEMIF